MKRSREWNKRNVFIPEETKNIRKIACSVCEKMFYPKTQFIVQKRVAQGGFGAAISGSFTEPELYDAMDCPECGCQVLLKGRLRNNDKLI